MWIAKGCDRCGGDLYKTYTEDGQVLCCLQCGHEFVVRPAHQPMSKEAVRALLLGSGDEPIAA